MDIKILGPSCANCLKLEVLVMQTLGELGIREATVEKVTVDREMEHYLTGDPPGLVINEQLVWSGGKEPPTKAQIAEWIREVTQALALQRPHRDENGMRSRPAFLCLKGRIWQLPNIWKHRLINLSSASRETAVTTTQTCGPSAKGIACASG